MSKSIGVHKQMVGESVERRLAWQRQTTKSDAIATNDDKNNAIITEHLFTTKNVSYDYHHHNNI